MVGRAPDFLTTGNRMKTTKQLTDEFRLRLLCFTSSLMLTIMLFNALPITSMLLGLTYSAVFMFYSAYVQDELKVRSGGFVKSMYWNKNDISKIRNGGWEE